MNLSQAQNDRRSRGDRLAETQAEQVLNSVGLTDALVLATANVSPADRQKLKGIITRLRGKAHPFTTCMADLREHHPEWSEDRRKKTCAVLKQLTGRGNSKGGSKLSESGAGACVLLDDGVAGLLELADLTKLKED